MAPGIMSSLFKAEGETGTWKPFVFFLFPVSYAAFMLFAQHLLNYQDVNAPSAFTLIVSCFGLALFLAIRYPCSDEHGRNRMDSSSLVSLVPYFIMHASTLLTGTTILMDIPLVGFFPLLNSMPAFFYIYDGILSRNLNVKTFIFPALVIVTSIPIGIIQARQNGISYFWILLFQVCLVSQVFYGRMADTRVGEMSRLYYCFIFTILTTLPISLLTYDIFHFSAFFVCMESSTFLGLIFACGITYALYATTEKAFQSHRFYSKILFLTQAVTLFISLFTFPYMPEPLEAVLLIANVGCIAFIPAAKSRDDADPPIC